MCLSFIKKNVAWRSGCVGLFRGSAESNATHGADSAVLSPPVREVIVVLLLQDVVGSSVVGLLVDHPAAATSQSNI